MHDLHLDFVGREFLQGLGQCFLRALYVGFDDEGEVFHIARGHLLKHVFKFRRLLFRQFDFTEFTLTEQGNFTRFALISQDHDFFTRCGYI